MEHDKDKECYGHELIVLKNVGFSYCKDSYWKITLHFDIASIILRVSETGLSSLTRWIIGGGGVYAALSVSRPLTAAAAAAAGPVVATRVLGRRWPRWLPRLLGPAVIAVLLCAVVVWWPPLCPAEPTLG